jgi:bis(5'-nucleosidyl)-tetraphosphatase
MTETECVIRQAGAIVVRPGTPLKVLLVRAKKNPAQWIFPKGHIEPDESAENAAVRELLEEAGVQGKSEQRAGESTYRLADKRYNVVYFVCRYIATENNGEQGRTPRWCTIDEALGLLTFNDSRGLLKQMILYLEGTVKKT